MKIKETKFKIIQKKFYKGWDYEGMYSSVRIIRVIKRNEFNYRRIERKNIIL